MFEMTNRSHEGLNSSIVTGTMYIVHEIRRRNDCQEGKLLFSVSSSRSSISNPEERSISASIIHKHPSFIVLFLISRF